jgi:hypothetical protein
MAYERIVVFMLCCSVVSRCWSLQVNSETKKLRLLQLLAETIGLKDLARSRCVRAASEEDALEEKEARSLRQRIDHASRSAHSALARISNEHHQVASNFCSNFE